MKNKEIAEIFNRIADILELREANRFRISAYRRAAQNLENYPLDIAEASEAGSLHEIPGIGKDLGAKIEEYLESGEIEYLGELLDETPDVLLDMLRVQGIGPKTALLLYNELDIESLADLKKAALEHRVQGLPKIKAKTEENILKGIEFLERSAGRIPIGTAFPLAEEIIDSLSKLPFVDKISAAGSLRRFRETVGDIDILVTSKKPVDVIRHFTALPLVTRILADGKTKGSVITSADIQVDLRVVAKESYGAALNYFTGSKEHNIRLREIAQQKKMKLSEYGLFKKIRGGKERRVAGKSEEEVYEKLGLPYIAPELREDTGEIEAAREGSLPSLVTLEDIKGDLHFHSDWSDGTASLEEVAEAGRKAGYKYLIISDHTKSLTIANGLTEERLVKQMKEIDRINARMKGFRLLKGSEVDILPDGSLDLDKRVLKKLDLIIIAVHSRFKMKRDDMTRRVIKALQHPFPTILAHPTGRLIGTREAYEIDMDAVIKAAADSRSAIEINAHPLRLDLDAATARKAAAARVPISISTDTHTPATEMKYMLYGVATARRGWLEPKHVINTLSAAKLLSLLSGKIGTK
jgi:DNA polymerase (family 10)